MTDSDPSSKKAEEMRNFRVDLTMVLVGLFLAIGVQSIIQYVVIIFPRIGADFYLGVGIASILMVFVFLNRAASIAGFDNRSQTDRR